MKIVVCMKETPSTESKKALGGDMRLVREPSDTVINPFDEYTIEEGLRLQEKHGGEVTILSMSPAKSMEVIRKGLAMGADRGVFITDPALAGADAVTTGKVLAAALQKIGFDIVLFGQGTADANGSVVPSVVAETLKLPLLAFANKLTIEGTTAQIERSNDIGYVTAQAQLPVLVSITKSINQPRFPSMKGIMTAKKKPLDTLTLADLGLGATTSKDKVVSVEMVSTQRKHEILIGNDGAAKRIFDYLIENKII